MNVRDWRKAVDEVLADPGPLKRDDKGPAVERLQGLLALAGHDPGPLDGDWGEKTQRAYTRFLPPEDWELAGALEQRTWTALTAPLRRAFEPLPKGWPSEFGLAMQDAAHQHLAERPRELGTNAGPWVRLYNGPFAERDRLPCECGHESMWHNAHPSRPGSCSVYPVPCSCREYRPNWRLAWCAGFASTLLYQAAEALGLEKPPIAGSLSCDVLARQARAVDEHEHLLWRSEGRHLYSAQGMKPLYHIHPGDLFLVRGSKAGDWTHVGAVLEVLPPGWGRVEGSVFTTLRHGGIRTAEGNTNEAGSREGVAVMKRVRPLTNLDFICWRRP